MSLHTYIHSMDVLADKGTGSHEGLADYEIVERSFAGYNIKLRLAADGRFIDIIEVNVNADFATRKQKAAVTGSWDASEYYTE